MDLTTILGILGGVILVCGAALPDVRGTRPFYSLKNWLFAIGGLVMLAYSLMNYADGGSVFFVFLEALINLASIFMMLETDDRIDVPILLLATVGLIVWSLFLFPGYRTILFILGLSGVGIGYALAPGTLKRDAALFIGSALITYFSYIEASWVFFWLNLFFAGFSLMQILRTANPRPVVPGS